MWPILKPPETPKKESFLPEKCHPEGPHPVLPISEDCFSEFEEAHPWQIILSTYKITHKS